MALYLVVPTFRREEALRQLLIAVGHQTTLPSLTIVVDNASSDDCAAVVSTIAEQIPQLRLKYVDAGTNTGSAGGTAVGMTTALTIAKDDDWIMRCDDDQLPASNNLFRTLLTEAQRCLAADAQTGAVGRNGARYDVRAARLVKPPHNSSSRFVPVDYLSTGWFPIFRVSAVREAGVFRTDLFFGFDEVEYGLRLTRRGYRLYRLDLPGHDRTLTRPPDLRLGSATWRRYYSLRNQIVISREYFGLGAALRVAMETGLLKPLANVPPTPGLALQHLQLNMKAITHAFQGRLGRAVEPSLIGGELDRREKEIRRWP
jgi:rhamnopyranosyl-N-acetylglucosaminyl-diphospho-decaprenol beta-1,3/1,4-galactofuranosyltransferase